MIQIHKNVHLDGCDGIPNVTRNLRKCRLKELFSFAVRKGHICQVSYPKNTICLCIKCSGNTIQYCNVNYTCTCITKLMSIVLKL